MGHRLLSELLRAVGARDAPRSVRASACRRVAGGAPPRGSPATRHRDLRVGQLLDLDPDVDGAEGFLHQRSDRFGEGGGAKTADTLGTVLLGQVPLIPEIRAGGDSGIPIVVSQPDSPAARIFREIGETLLARVNKPRTVTSG